jgi:hypothetical protein
MVTSRCGRLLIDIELSNASGYILRVPFNQIFDLQSHTDIIRNVVVTEKIEFENDEGKGSWCPVRGTCNGRAMRGVMCVIDKDERRFKMIDLAEHGNVDAV